MTTTTTIGFGDGATVLLLLVLAGDAAMLLPSAHGASPGVGANLR